METITVKMRLEYYWSLFKEAYGCDISYRDFMEALFSKLEQEIRDKTSRLDGYAILKPKTLKQEEFKYDYN